MSTDLDDAFERDETMAHVRTPVEGGDVIAMPEPRSRLDALEATIVVEPEQGRTDEQHGDQHDGSDEAELITAELLAEHNA
jgi:hypothetical protein